MRPEVIRRFPRESSNRSKVLRAVNNGFPAGDFVGISEETGLTKIKIIKTLSDLRHEGYLPRSTRDETRRLRQIAESVVFLPVKPYREELRMSPREIEIALSIDGQKELTSVQIRAAIVYGTKHGNLRSMSKEERRDMKRDAVKLSKEQVLAMVVSWLELRDLLTKQGIAFPTDRLEWKRMAAELKNFKGREKIVSSIEPLKLRKITNQDLNKIMQQGEEKGAMSDEEKHYAFAAKCLNQGLIGENTLRWKVLGVLYEFILKRSLPESFPDRIRLEAFLYALLELRQGNMEVWNIYCNIGKELDPNWFHTSLRMEENSLAKHFDYSIILNSNKIAPIVNSIEYREPTGTEDGRIIYNKREYKTSQQVVGKGMQRPNGNRISHGGRHIGNYQSMKK